MDKSLKQSWDEIENYLPDINHPAINMLRDGLGKTIPIQIQLQKNGQKVLDAKVNLQLSSYVAQEPALAVLLKKLEKYGLTVEWDTVSFHEDGSQPMPASAFPMNQPHIRWIEQGIMQDFNDCMDALDSISNRMLQLEPEEYAERYPKDLAALIVGATATVISEDMERLIKLKKRWFPLPFIDFQGKNLEL